MTGFLLSFILASCRESAADVPLCFVDLKNAAHLPIELRVDLPQAFRNIFMYSGFADVKFFRGRTDGSSVFENILP